MTNFISFPGLGFEFEINRIAFSVFGKPIYWYAIIIAFGFLLAVFYGFSRSREFDVSDDDIINMLVFAVPFAIVFARLYYVVFNFEPYRNNLVEVFYIWEGGIAIYGAIIGSSLGALVYCKLKKKRLISFLDIGALGLMIGQAIGRWGNFVNAEAYGRVTDLPWRMQIGYAACVHPTFLYESLWNALGFAILHFYSKHRKFCGEIFLLYVFWYGLGRAWIEGLRTDSLYLFGTGIRTSQALAALTLVVSAAILVYKYKRIKSEVKR
ncbi:MAG: prolipoprotein diacylglyceryl transferase [Oscillospiraceae bacterium]|nr:prolipoprotein diacylglyceryl transferase [Oscillospiraceae bacterium]